jgi:hypothetical protein
MSDQEHNVCHRSSIELHIEELVLHGFSAGDRYAIADGLQHELVRLMTEEKFSMPIPFDTRLESFDAGQIRVASGSRPSMIAGQVAHAVVGGLAKSWAGPRDNSTSHRENT